MNCPKCSRNWNSGTICPYCDCKLEGQAKDLALIEHRTFEEICHSLKREGWKPANGCEVFRSLDRVKVVWFNGTTAEGVTE